MSKVERETATRSIVRRLKNAVLRLAREEASRALNHFRENWRRTRPVSGSRRILGEEPGHPKGAGKPALEQHEAAANPSPAIPGQPARRLQAAVPGDPDSVRKGRAKARPLKNAARERAAAKTHLRDAAIKSPERHQPREEKGIEGSPERIHLNAASREELMTLVGIGPSRAEAIIAARPYARARDLVERKILPQAIFDGIEKQVTAGD